MSYRFLARMFSYITFVQATEPSQLWVDDLNALGAVLDEIAEINRKQDVEDAKQRKNAGKGRVRWKCSDVGQIDQIDLHRSVLCDLRDLYSTDQAQGTCPLSCMSCGSRAAT